MPLPSSTKSPPDTPSSEHAARAQDWALVDTVLAGRRAMVDAGRQLLPQHEGETETEWTNRLRGAVLYPGLSRVLRLWAAVPFRRAARLEPPPVLSALARDADGLGTPLVQWAADVFSLGLRHGAVHVLVERSARAAANLAEEAPPYLVPLRAPDVLALRRDAAGRATELRVKEVTAERVPEDPWRDQAVTRVRAYSWADGLVAVRVFRLDDHNKWQEEDAPEPFSAPRGVPVFSFFPEERQGDLVGAIPLLELAEINARHWRSNSEQHAILAVTRFPLLGASGINEDEANNLQIGPRRLLYSADSRGRFYYVEHSGAAIAAGERDLERLEAQMAAFGATWMLPKPGRPTATDRVHDEAAVSTPLQRAIVRFQEFVGDLMAGAAGDEGARGEQELDLDAATALSATDALMLTQGLKLGAVSPGVFLGELARRGVIPQEAAESGAPTRPPGEDEDEV